MESPNIVIDEHFGNASSGTPEISIAHVKAKGTWDEAWQAPDFDEYVLMLKGSVNIEHEGGTTTVKAGQGLLLKKGERVRWRFTEDAEYVPICLPGFTPDNCNREE